MLLENAGLYYLSEDTPNLCIVSFYIVWKYSLTDYIKKSIFQLRLAVAKGLISLTLAVHKIYYSKWKCAWKKKLFNRIVTVLANLYSC